MGTFLAGNVWVTHISGVSGSMRTWHLDQAMSMTHLSSFLKGNLDYY